MKHTHIVLAIPMLSVAVAGFAFPQLGQEHLTEAKTYTLTCPEVSDLYYDSKTRFWHSRVGSGNWKVYGTSFETTLQTFAGAEFIGNTVGHISCVYLNTQQQTAMPVIFHFGSLTNKPPEKQQLYKWGRMKSGWMKCISNTTGDCSFTITIRPHIKNIYDSLQNMKRKPSILNQEITHFQSVRAHDVQSFQICARGVFGCWIADLMAIHILWYCPRWLFCMLGDYPTLATIIDAKIKHLGNHVGQTNTLVVTCRPAP